MTPRQRINRVRAAIAATYANGDSRVARSDIAWLCQIAQRAQDLLMACDTIGESPDALPGTMQFLRDAFDGRDHDGYARVGADDSDGGGARERGGGCPPGAGDGGGHGR